jgi:hypothetical protein
MQAGNRILALDPGNEVVDGGLIRQLADDLEQPGALAGLLGVGRNQ